MGIYSWNCHTAIVEDGDEQNKYEKIGMYIASFVAIRIMEQHGQVDKISALRGQSL